MATQTHLAPQHRRTWLHHPQRLLLRRAVFQIHLWLGLLVTLYAAVIGLSGSALVFRAEIERTLNPQLLHLQPGPRPVSLDAAIRRIAADRPGWTVSALRDFDQPGTAPTVLLRPTAGPVTADYRAVSFNPATGEVLLDTTRYAGVLGFCTNLHFYLLAGKTGLAVSGWMALALLLLCLTGLVLWWPGVRRALSALVLHRRASWRRLNWDLHAVLGFWICLPLAFVTFTGLYFAFPKPIAAITILASGGTVAQARADDEPAPKPVHPMPATNPAKLSIDEAIARARQLLPAAAPPAYMTIPGPKAATYYVTGYYRGSLPYSQLVSITFDAHTGALLNRTDTRDGIRGKRLIQHFFTLHFGSFGGDGWFGWVIKSLWVLLGLAPAALALTGLLMYWNRKLNPLRKRWLANA